MQSAQLDKHVARVNLPDLQKKGKELAPELTAEQKTKIIEIYNQVRPVLDFFDGFFIIPKKWRNVIKAFMNAMDAATGWTKEQK